MRLDERNTNTTRLQSPESVFGPVFRRSRNPKMSPEYYPLSPFHSEYNQAKRAPFADRPPCSVVSRPTPPPGSCPPNRRQTLCRTAFPYAAAEQMFRKQSHRKERVNGGVERGEASDLSKPIWMTKEKKKSKVAG